ncbi:hypothetical protein GCM10025868_18510 [Angustibacter aerolatus]|uniref:Uncharacterized protein n=1 Tax=Angustibacter aerolatus TaxID=1162965 RepID=A0ABQ6JIK1_9ACTN|nr:hypothetical protein GCM10025868_18510 [Angustibacter aerolatus]
MYRPVITFPTSVPGGGVAEQAKIVRQPYLSSRSRSKWVYRFSVQQHIVHMPGGQTFDLEPAGPPRGARPRCRLRAPVPDQAEVQCVPAVSRRTGVVTRAAVA